MFMDGVVRKKMEQGVVMLEYSKGWIVLIDKYTWLITSLIKVFGKSLISPFSVCLVS